MIKAPWNHPVQLARAVCTATALCVYVCVCIIKGRVITLRHGEANVPDELSRDPATEQQTRKESSLAGTWRRSGILAGSFPIRIPVGRSPSRWSEQSIVGFVNFRDDVSRLLAVLTSKRIKKKKKKSKRQCSTTSCFVFDRSLNNLFVSTRDTGSRNWQRVEREREGITLKGIDRGRQTRLRQRDG